MNIKCIILKLYLLYGFCNVDCRKYDIEMEAQKIYGEDLASVLRRFRKTTEYLSILESKLSDLKMNYDVILANLYLYYDRKIDEKILETLGMNETDSETFGKKKMLRNYYPDIRRQNEDTQMPANLTGVEKIDSYKKLRSYLTVEERNKFKDMGFEFAGHVIHEMMKAFSDEGLDSSTLLPYGADEDVGITTHNHQVTHETTVEPPSAEYASALPDTFRHKPHNVF